MTYSMTVSSYKFKYHTNAFANKKAEKSSYYDLKEHGLKINKLYSFYNSNPIIIVK